MKASEKFFCIRVRNNKTFGQVAKMADVSNFSFDKAQYWLDVQIIFGQLDIGWLQPLASSLKTSSLFWNQFAQELCVLTQ